MRQELEEWGVGPVEVFDDDDRRPVRGDRFDEPPPGRKRLFARLGLAGIDSEQREEARLEPAALVHIRERLVQLRGRRLRRV